MKALLLAAFAASSMIGCSQQVADFVDGARQPDSILPRLQLKDDSAPKISPARIQSAGSTVRMTGNFTLTNHQLKGTKSSAMVTVSRTSNP